VGVWPATWLKLLTENTNAYSKVVGNLGERECLEKLGGRDDMILKWILKT